MIACSEKTGTLQSINSDRVVHKQSIAQAKWKTTHFLLDLYLDFGLVGKLYIHLLSVYMSENGSQKGK